MSLEARVARSQQPAWLTDAHPSQDPVDILFWSGGKDSLLAWRALARESARPVVLLTTFDAATRVVAHQEIALDAVVRQALHLGAPLLGVPLHPGCRYDGRIREACELVPRFVRLVFGDLHLLHIREWRTVAFQELAADRGASLHFPLWGAPYGELLADLEDSGVRCEVSAVTQPAKEAVRVGDRFGRRLVESLPGHIDAFGEHGEFHTLARVWEAE